MRGMLKWLLAGVVGLGLAAQAVMAADEAKKPESEAMGWGTGATLTPLVKAPTLDGKIEPGEYSRAVSTVNFIQTFFANPPAAGPNGPNFDKREGRTWCGYYDGRLYIAVVSDLPPRSWGKEGKHSNVMNRDAELVFDPNPVEIWLDPNRDRRESREGDQGFYQFFINSVGSLYDARLEPGKGVEKGFNCDIQCANGIDDDKKIWTLEASISLKDLGWEPGTEIGRSLGVLVCRGYKAPWTQPTWFPIGGGFIEWYRYPRLTITKDEPVVQIESLGKHYWQARPEFQVLINNPGSARKAKVNMHIRSSDMPDLLDEKIVELPANGSAEYRYKPGEGALHERAEHYFKITVQDAVDAKSWFNYFAGWTIDPMTKKGWSAVRWSTLYDLDQKWAQRLKAAPDRAVGFSAYPSLNRLRVQMDSSCLVDDPEGKDKDRVSDSVDLTITREGKQIASKTFKLDIEKKNFTAANLFEFAEMPEGEYLISAKFNKQDAPITKIFKRVKFEFEGNKLGITDKVFPPFKPVTAAGDKVGVVDRTFTVGELGLWSSVESLGKELLASPIVLKADDARILTGKAKLLSATAQAAVYQATAVDEAVTVKSTCTTELDGCMKVELELAPGSKNAELKNLVLDIPLKDSLMPLWHATTTAVRVNPVGDIPQGEGIVWDSTKFPNGDWNGAFTPYIWLGAEERGLAAFANNDKGWLLNWNEKKQFTPCQQLIRKDGVLTLRLNLVQKPVTLTEPRKITLGLIVTPTKPMRKDWRKILCWGSDLGKGFESLPKLTFNMPWGTGETFCAAYPWKKDYSLYDAGLGIKGTPGNDFVEKNGWGAYVTDYKARHGLDKPVEQLNDYEKRVVNVGRGGTSNLHVKYWDEYHGDSRSHPEVQTFAGEFSGNNMCTSRRDFRVYHAAEFAKRGIGLYFDNTFPHASRDMLTSDAYEIPGIGIQPSANLWEQRDYHRRIWNVQKELYAEGKTNGIEVIQQIHHTNCLMATFATWTDSTCDLEWFYGPEPQQSKYHDDMLRAETAARQVGCIPFALARTMYFKVPQEEYIANRTQFGTMMVHDIKVESMKGNSPQQYLGRALYGAGYADDDAQVFNYWDENNPVRTSIPQVKTLLVKKGAELMLLAVSWDQNPLAVELTLDTKALGLQPTTASNGEGTPEELVAQQLQRCEPLEKAIMRTKDELKKEQANKEVDAKKVVAYEESIVKQEKWLEAAKAVAVFVEAEAKLPVAYDPASGKLSLQMNGYGVRLIKLK